MKALRVLVLMDPALVPPDSTKGYTAQEVNEWKTEYDIVSTLRAAGHEVRPFGVEDELKAVRDEIDGFKPDVVFTLLEDFHGKVIYDQNIASFLELMQIPYTGCNPRGLILARGKDLSKTLVHHRRIPTPAFAVFPKGRKVKRPKRLALPLIVKSLSEDASLGISQASVVDTDEKLAERVAFIHERIRTAAIAEQYIEGREIYVGVLGNERLRVLPVWELKFKNLGPGCPAHRDREGQARYQLSGARRDRGWAGQGSRTGAVRAGFNEPRNESTGHSISTDMRVSTFASLPTAFRISSKRTPIPKSRRARSSRQRRSMTVSRTRTCCIAFWRSALSRAKAGVSAS